MSAWLDRLEEWAEANPFLVRVVIPWISCAVCFGCGVIVGKVL